MVFRYVHVMEDGSNVDAFKTKNLLSLMLVDHNEYLAQFSNEAGVVGVFSFEVNDHHKIIIE